MRRRALQPYIKKTMRWYFLSHGISCLLITKMFLCWIFWRWKIRYFWAKKLMEIWYLLITEKFLFWSFREWEMRSFLSQKVDGKMIFTGCWEVLVLNFSVMGKAAYFSAKKLMERWYLLGLSELQPQVSSSYLLWLPSNRPSWET